MMLTKYVYVSGGWLPVSQIWFWEKSKDGTIFMSML